MPGLKNGFNPDIENAPLKKARYCFALTALLGALLIIYWPGFAGDWYLDDFGNIHENPNVHLTSLNPGDISKSFYGMDQNHNGFNLCFFCQS